jgi:hypothetical protein
MIIKDHPINKPERDGFVMNFVEEAIREYEFDYYDDDFNGIF